MSEQQAPTSTEALRAEIGRLQQQVDELTRANAALQQSADGFEMAFTRAPYNIAIMEMLPDGGFYPLASNPKTDAMLGIQRDQQAATAEAQVEFDAATLRGIAERLHRCLRDGAPLDIEEELNVGGKVIWTQAIYAPVGVGPGGHPRVLITSFDITDRRQQLHREIQDREAVIEQQMLTLAELSTPMLALSDEVVVLPLIGAIDSRRAQQIMDSLLTGIAEKRASVAILDITGVAVVDTQVANALIRAAQAVQLLGARVILTGIRPEIAQTLVGLGVDLSAIITRSSLQSAIAYSLGR